MSKYASIKTTTELDKAIQEVHAKRSKLGRGLDHEIHGIRNRMKPANLMLTAAGRYLPALGWSELSLGLVRGLKKLLRK